jgi:replicative DNA helicase
MTKINNGKYFAKGTKIIQYNGYLINIENVKVGDQLMCDDSKPRKILNIIKGKDSLFKITNLQSQEIYITNSHHILSVIYNNNIINLPIKDVFEKQHLYKGYKIPVNFITKKLPSIIDPYLYGYYLNNYQINKNDNHIINYLDNHNYTQEMIYDMYMYDISKCIINDKYIRKHLLAGIIDSQARKTKNQYIIYSNNIIDLEDIQFLVRSLGINCYIQNIISYKNSIIINNKLIDDDRINYYKLFIDKCNLPVLKKWKKFNKSKKNVITYDIKIESCGIGEYYGLELNENNKYLLSDFSI